MPLQDNPGNVGQADEVPLVNLIHRDCSVSIRAVISSSVISGAADSDCLPPLGLMKIARVLVRFDHVASIVVNTNHGIM
jgi:hypothetical protein